MIEINGVKFAESARESIDSLFNPGGTATLRAKRHKRRILLFWPNGEPLGIVQNGLIGTATRQPDGSIWYSYGTPAPLGELSFGQMMAAIDSLAVGRDARGRIFKQGAAA